MFDLTVNPKRIVLAWALYLVYKWMHQRLVLKLALPSVKQEIVDRHQAGLYSNLVLITGVTGGLGYASAKLLIENGIPVAGMLFACLRVYVSPFCKCRPNNYLGADLSLEMLVKLQEEFGGDMFIPLQMDVTNKDSVEKGKAK